MFHVATLDRTDRRLSVTDSQTVSNDSFKTFIVPSENGVKTAKNDGRNVGRFRSYVNDHRNGHRLSPYFTVLRCIVNDHLNYGRFSPFLNRLRPFTDRSIRHGIKTKCQLEFKSKQ